jgi:hypothetical protein
MTEQQLAAVKLALELMHNRGDVGVDEWIAAEAAIKQVIAQDALHKMAEESRTSGLRLDDWDKIGCVNHDCDKCKAVQEPVKARHTGWGYLDGQVVATYAVPVNAQIAPDLYTTPPTPQPVPVKTYHDGKPWPVAPKPWVGLSEEEVYEAAHYCVKSGQSVNETIRAIEAKLKEKNT